MAAGRPGALLREAAAHEALLREAVPVVVPQPAAGQDGAGRQDVVVQPSAADPSAGLSASRRVPPRPGP